MGSSLLPVPFSQITSRETNPPTGMFDSRSESRAMARFLRIAEEAALREYCTAPIGFNVIELSDRRLDCDLIRRHKLAVRRIS